MKASDIMTKKVKTIRKDATFKELWKLITMGHINALPVVDGRQKLIGIVTKEDVLFKLYPDYQEFFESVTSSDETLPSDRDVSDILKIRVEKVMKRNVIFARPETSVMRILARMLARHVDQIPIVSSSGCIVGLITKSDIFYSLYKFHKDLLSFKKK